MNLLKVSLGLVFFIVGNSAHACIWVNQGADTIDRKVMECRLPYRRFFSSNDKRKSSLLNIAFANAKRSLQDILSKEPIFALLLDYDKLGIKPGEKISLTETPDSIRKIESKSMEIMEQINSVTLVADNLQDGSGPFATFNDGTIDLAPSAMMFGVTVPMTKGVDLGKVLPTKFITRFIGDFEAGGGSAFLAGILLPQVVMYRAEYSRTGEFNIPQGAQQIYPGKGDKDDPHIRVWDLSGQSPWSLSRMRIPWVNPQLHPTIDIRAKRKTEGEVVAKKKGGIQPTIGFVWGENLFTPDQVGNYGFSYSLPTSLTRTTAGGKSGYVMSRLHNTVLGKTYITGPVTWGLLRLFGMLGIETVKFSWNSADGAIQDVENIELGIESVPFDQLIVTFRGGDLKVGKKSGAAATPLQNTSEARFGWNFGIDEDFVTGVMNFAGPYVKDVAGVFWGDKESPEEAEVKAAVAEQSAARQEAHFDRAVEGVLGEGAAQGAINALDSVLSEESIDPAKKSAIIKQVREKLQAE